MKTLREGTHSPIPTPRQAEEAFTQMKVPVCSQSVKETLLQCSLPLDMWKHCGFQSKMASIYIVNALATICLALCGLSLGEDAGSQACVTAKPCICSGTRVSCKKRQLQGIPQGIPLQTTSLWVKRFLVFFLVVCRLQASFTLAQQRFKIP